MAKILLSVCLALLLLRPQAILAGGFDKPWAIDEVIGSTDAPITIIEYSSLTCPHCAHFHAETFPRLKKEWIDTGKAKLILRDFVWDPAAQAAAMIAHCSGDRYFQFIDIYFHSQANWVRAAQPIDALRAIARLGGMSNDQLDQCLQNNALLDQIDARSVDGEKLYQVNSTPSFIVNGKLVATGFLDYDSFAALLQAQK